MLKKSGWLAAALLVPLFGCASDGTAPRAELNEAEQEITAAVDANAQDAAPMALREARTKLSQAREATYNREFDRARLLAIEAQVSAELAREQAQTKRTEDLAEEAMAGVRTLREELNRKEATQ